MIAASALSIAGAAVGLTLVLVAWFGGAAICPLCFSIHAASLRSCSRFSAVARPLRAQGGARARNLVEARDIQP
jgi:hypothetical protein